MSYALLSVLFAGAAVAAIGCASADTAASTSPTIPLDAATLFAQNCKSCHGDQAQGVAGVGPNMAKILNAEKDVFTNDAFVTLLRRGTDPEGKSICAVMPKFAATVISDDQVLSLRTYVLSLPVSPTDADVPRACK